MSFSTVTTILGTAALGLLKGRFGSNARRIPIVKKTFDGVLLNFSSWVKGGRERKEIFLLAPKLDGILYIRFESDRNHCNVWDGEVWCYAVIYLILEPNGKYANWAEDENIYKELIELAESTFVYNYVHQAARDNDLSITQEDNIFETDLCEIELFSDIYGNPIVKSERESNLVKLRRR